MTASTKTGTRAVADFPIAGPADKGVVQISVGTYNFVATDDEAGDVFELCWVPGGATVFGGYLQGKDLESSGTVALDIDIGWLGNGVEAADPDGFGNLGTWSGAAVTDFKPETGNYFPLGGVLHSTGPQYFSRDTKIALTVNAAATTLAPGPVTAVLYWAFLGDGAV